MAAQFPAEEFWRAINDKLDEIKIENRFFIPLLCSMIAILRNNGLQVVFKEKFEEGDDAYYDSEKNTIYINIDGTTEFTSKKVVNEYTARFIHECFHAVLVFLRSIPESTSEGEGLSESEQIPVSISEGEGLSESAEQIPESASDGEYFSESIEQTSENISVIIQNLSRSKKQLSRIENEIRVFLGKLNSEVKETYEYLISGVDISYDDFTRYLQQIEIYEYFDKIFGFDGIDAYPKYLFEEYLARTLEGSLFRESIVEEIPWAGELLEVISLQMENYLQELIYLAVMSNDLEVVKAIFSSLNDEQKNALLMQVDEDGMTLLQGAMINNSEEMIKALILDEYGMLRPGMMEQSCGSSSVLSLFGDGSESQFSSFNYPGIFSQLSQRSPLPETVCAAEIPTSMDFQFS